MSGFDLAFPGDLTVSAIKAEVSRARIKFPKPDMTLAALVEEVGELSEAMLDLQRGKGDRDAMEIEAIQVAAMAIRIIEEGDLTMPKTLPRLRRRSCLY